MIQILKCYKWGCYRTGITKYSNHISIMILGLAIEIMFNKRRFIEDCKKVARSLDDDENKWVKYTFPFSKKKF